MKMSGKNRGYQSWVWMLVLVGSLMLLAGCGNSTTKYINNSIPEPHAGHDQFVQTGSTVQLDGSLSFDSDTAPLNYKWVIDYKPYGSEASLSDAQSVKPTFVADKNGLYLIKLVVNDGKTDSYPAYTCVNASRGYQRLDFQVVDVEYSDELTKLVFVEANPNQLHLFDPMTSTDQTIDLPFAPKFVSVSPDGLSAVVAFENSLGHVELIEGAEVNLIPYANSINSVTDVIAGGNGYAYVLSENHAHYINLNTKELTEFESDFSRELRGQLHPGGAYLYIAGGKMLRKYDISSGGAIFLNEGNEAEYLRYDNNIWISADGQLMVNDHGEVLNSSNAQATDMSLYGNLPEVDDLISAKITSDSIYAIHTDFYDELEDVLWIYDRASLDLVNAIDMPLIPKGSSLYQSWAKFVLANQAGDRIYVVLQMDEAAGTLNDFAVVTY